MREDLTSKTGASWLTSQKNVDQDLFGVLLVKISHLEYILRRCTPLWGRRAHRWPQGPPLRARRACVGAPANLSETTYHPRVSKWAQLWQLRRISPAARWCSNLFFCHRLPYSFWVKQAKKDKTYFLMPWGGGVFMRVSWARRARDWGSANHFWKKRVLTFKKNVDQDFFGVLLVNLSHLEYILRRCTPLWGP